MSPAKQKQLEKFALANSASVVDFSERYFKEVIEKDRKDTKQLRRYLEKEIYPAFGTWALRDVTAHDVQRLVFKKRDNGFESAAAQLRNLLKRIFDYAIVCGIVTSNPTHATPMRFITRARPRTRSLSPDELKIYLQVLYRSNIRRQFKLTLHIILLTLVRKSELLQARWINVNLDDGEWLTPEAQSKTGKPHTVYLSTQVREMFVELWQLAGDSELVLPGRGSLTRPFAANALNQAMGAMSFPIPPFTIHDLRRTGSTILHEQGYSSDVVEKALNHTIGGVRGVYNRAEYADQRRAMLQSWADYISGLNGHFTSERTQLMSDVEVTKVSKVEDSGEIFSAFEHHGIYDRVHRYSYLPDPYPILPNFGVLYLSVPRAASLIAHHLATNISDSPREEKKAELRSALTAQVQARILQEVISGRLPSVTTIADTGNLTVQRDERI